MLADQINQSVNGFALWDVELHGRLADVEIDFSWCAADVTKVSIGHFARTIYNTTHDRDFYPLEV